MFFNSIFENDSKRKPEASVGEGAPKLGDNGGKGPLRNPLPLPHGHGESQMFRC